MMKTKNFTLVELMVSMAVLSIFMLGMIQLFTSIQKMISITTAKNELFAYSRIIMDMISNDVECLYVDREAKNCTFMAQSSKDGNTESFRLATRKTDRINGSQSNIAAISYDYNADKMSLKLTTCGDNSNEWQIGEEINGLGKSNNNFSRFNINSPKAVEVMDGIVSFYVCFAKRQGDKIMPESLSEDEVCKGTIPDLVTIQISLIDSATIKKLEAALELDVYSGDGRTLTRKEIDKNKKAKKILEENTRTFTRTIPVLR